VNKSQIGKVSKVKGMKRTEQQRKNISNGTKIGMKINNSSQKISIAKKGKKLSEEHKRKDSEALKKWHKENKETEKYKIRCSKISKSQKNKKTSEESKEKNRISHLGKTHSKETKQLCSIKSSNAIIEGKIKPNSDVYKHGYFFSKLNNKEFYYRSLYELAAYILLDDEDSQSIIKEWKTECLRIPYKYNGLIKNHVIDIFIEYKSGKKQIINVKPSGRTNEKQNIVIFKATQKYCDENNIVFSIWTEKELGITKKRYKELEKNHKKLQGVINV
jgi:hypothetical protein